MPSSRVIPDPLPKQVSEIPVEIRSEGPVTVLRHHAMLKSSNPFLSRHSIASSYDKWYMDSRHDLKCTIPREPCSLIMRLDSSTWIIQCTLVSCAAVIKAFTLTLTLHLLQPRARNGGHHLPGCSVRPVICGPRGYCTWCMFPLMLLYPSCVPPYVAIPVVSAPSGYYTRCTCPLRLLQPL